MDSDELTKILSIQQKAFTDATQLLFNSLNQRIEDQNKLIYDLKHSLEFSQSELRETKNQLADYIKLSGELKDLTTNLNISINKLQYQADQQEDYTRFNNVRIEGILEKKDESIEQIHHKISKMFSDKMQLSNIEIDKIHRLPNKQPNISSSQPRTIIARLLKTSDRNLILKNSHKLKNTGIFVNEDVSEGTMKVRREKLDELKEARRNGKIAYFVGRRLIIHERKQPNMNKSTNIDSTSPKRNNVSNLIEVFNPNDGSVLASTPHSGTIDPTEDTQSSLSQPNRRGLRPRN